MKRLFIGGLASAREQASWDWPGRGMPFRVINVICRYNSGSGGPPRTVSAIARAGLGVWISDLFTTDHVEANADSLLVDQFPGHVQLMPRNAETLIGSVMMASGLWPSYRAPLSRGIYPDVVHLHGVWSPYLAAFAHLARAKGMPYIVAPHGMLEPWPLSVNQGRKTLALKTFQGKVFRDAAGIHTTSEGEAANFRRLNLTRAPIFVVPNSIEAPTADIRERRPTAGKKVLLFLSRVHPKKGLDMLLRAWAELHPAGWELSIVGHGDSDYVESLKQLCRTARIAGVTFYSHVNGDAREAEFSRATAFVLPTYSENFGNVVGEAMIRGLPVITTTGTPWSAIAAENLGWYIEPTLEALKGALTELFGTGTDALAAMGDRGRDYVRRNLLEDVVRPKLLEMYRAAIHGAKAER